MFRFEKIDSHQLSTFPICELNGNFYGVPVCWSSTLTRCQKRPWKTSIILSRKSTSRSSTFPLWPETQVLRKTYARSAICSRKSGANSKKQRSKMSDDRLLCCTRVYCQVLNYDSTIHEWALFSEWSASSLASTTASTFWGLLLTPLIVGQHSIIRLSNFIRTITAWRRKTTDPSI